MQMNQKEALRFTLLMGDEGSSFYSNLSRIVQSVLFSENKPLFLKAIISCIKRDYDLAFSIKEIENVVEKDSQKNFLVQLSEKGKVVRLTQKAFDSMKSLNESELSLENVNSLFISENNESLMFIRGNKVKIIKNALINLFYGIFNSNIDSLKLFLDNKYETAIKQIELDNLHRRISLLFLKWENAEKEKLIYRFIKSSYDYCSLSMKTSTDGFKEVFKTKKFLLDTNIVLSLVGINGKGLKEATNSFLSKAKEAGIEICYTNYTKEEIDNTIYGLVERLKAYQNLSYTLPEGAEDDIIDFYHVSDISSLYLDWCNDKPFERIDNYTLFLEWINAEISNKIFDLKLVYIDSAFEKDNSKEINDCVNSLRSAKTNNGLDSKMPSLKHDSINYLNIKKSRNINTVSVSEQECFFVSQDNNLIEWAKRQEAGMPTFVVSPTTMYTILLRFHGRTGDDFKAFNNYICLSIDYKCDESALFDTRKQISVILSETKEDKEKLKKVFIETNRIINKRILAGEPIGEAKEIVETAYDSVLTEAQNELDESNQKHAEELESAKKDSFEKGANAERSLVVEGLADKYTNNWIIFKKIVILLVCLILLIGIFLIGLFAFKYATRSEENMDYALLVIGIITTASPATWFLLTMIFKFVFKINFFDFDYERIKNIKRPKAAKKYDKLKRIK